MGDRVYTSVSISSKYEGLVDLLLQVNGIEYPKEEKSEPNITVYFDGQANHADMKNMENLLIDNKIPFDLNWERGSQFSAGTRVCRAFKDHNGNLDHVVWDWTENDEYVSVERLLSIYDLRGSDPVIAELKKMENITRVREKLPNVGFYPEHRSLFVEVST